jgi:hypothetical protein
MLSLHQQCSSDNLTIHVNTQLVMGGLPAFLPGCIHEKKTRTCDTPNMIYM